uniref:Uncharacterized protein n=1 Tax=Anguilla anguilla TaxID=7936 RepID=A0A0E9WVN5_ANGAN
MPMLNMHVHLAMQLFLFFQNLCKCKSSRSFEILCFLYLFFFFCFLVSYKNFPSSFYTVLYITFTFVPLSYGSHFFFHYLSVIGHVITLTRFVW